MQIMQLITIHKKKFCVKFESPPSSKSSLNVHAIFKQNFKIVLFLLVYIQSVFYTVTFINDAAFRKEKEKIQSKLFTSRKVPVHIYN